MSEKKFDPFTHSKTYRTWFGHTVSDAPGGFYSPGMSQYNPTPPQEQNKENSSKPRTQELTPK